MKVGQKLMGTDGQCYRVREFCKDTNAGSVTVVGIAATIQFNPCSMEVYELLGSPQTSGRVHLVKGSEKEAARLWSAKEKALSKFLEELKAGVPGEEKTYADLLLASEHVHPKSLSPKKLKRAIAQANKELLKGHPELTPLAEKAKK